MASQGKSGALPLNEGKKKNCGGQGPNLLLKLSIFDVLETLMEDEFRFHDKNYISFTNTNCYWFFLWHCYFGAPLKNGARISPPPRSYVTEFYVTKQHHIRLGLYEGWRTVIGLQSNLSYSTTHLRFSHCQIKRLV